MDKLGFLLLMIGCAGMNDIPNRPIATTYVLVGLAFIVITLLKEKSFSPNRPK